MSDNINIVLVNTSHPGNIGSTARAMKTMGLKKLKLVNPKNYPSKVADAKAVGCIDVLENASIYDSIDKAIAKSRLVVGLSARSRKSNIPSLSLKELMILIQNHLNNEISILFGNEQSGLSNEELLRCNYLVSIPTDKSYTSLNLSAAVQIFSYEYFMSQSGPDKKLIHTEEPASFSSKKHLIDNFILIMKMLNMFSVKNEKSLTQNIHIIFNKTQFTNKEINLYSGVITKIKNALKK